MSFAAVVERLLTLENPYPGLRPFETGESHLFFGRDQQVAELVGRLERNRFVAVLGVSGSGKSSLVRAGLIPALERGRVTEAGRTWRIVITRPAGAPFETLADSLVRAGLDASGLRDSSHGLIAVARQLPADESLLVVVDQFEELFRYKDVEPTSEAARRRHDAAAADAAEFVQLLLAASRHQPPVYVVLTMRSDYLGECAEFRDLPEALNDCQYLVPRMTREQRKDAITGPLGRVECAPSLIQRLLNDAGDEPDQLSVLQHALMRTWSQWHSADPGQTRRIELHDYEEIGGFGGALDQHATQLLTGVPPAIAAMVFKRLTAKGRNNRERRDPATLGELWAVCGAETPEQQAAVTTTIDHFRRREATFLAPRDGGLGPDTYIDITHESLIRQWRLLRDEWVPEERRSARTFVDLVQRSARWKAGEAELLTGLDLMDAVAWERDRNRSVAWAEHYATAADLDRVLEFIRASQASARKRRFRKRATWLAAPIVVGFLALGVVALYQWRNAESAGRVALARQLAAQAQLSQSDQLDIEDAARLAIASMRTTFSADGDRALRAATALLPHTIVRFDLASEVSAIAMTPDGRYVIAIGSDGELRRFDRTTQKEAPLTLETGRTIELSANGRWLALRRDGGMSIVSLAATPPRETARVQASDGAKLEFCADGAYFVVVEEDRRFQVFLSSNGMRLGGVELEGALPPRPSFSVSPDGRRVAVGNRADPGEDSVDADDNTVRLFEVDQAALQPGSNRAVGREISRLGHQGAIESVIFSADGQYLVTGSEDGTARVVEASSGKEVARLAHDGPVKAVAISANARWVATGSDDRTARVFEAATGTEVARVMHAAPVTAVAFSGDERWAISASKSSPAEIRVFEAAGGPEQWRQRQAHGVTSASFSADGRRVAIGSGHVEAANVQVFEAPDGREIFAFTPFEPEVRTVAISSNGEWVAAGGGLLGQTRVFKTDDRRLPVRSITPPPPVLSLAISDDGNRIALLDFNKTVRVFDGTNEIGSIQDPFNHAMALTPDGRRLVVGGGSLDGGTVRVFDLDAGGGSPGAPWKAIREFTQREPVFAVAMTPDGRWAAAGSGAQGATMRVYRVDSGEAAWFQRGELGTVIALSADAGLAATATPDGIVKVFELATGRRETVLRLPLGGPAVGLRFIEQGRYLMTASSHKALGGTSEVVVSRHPMRVQDLIDDACSRVTRNPDDNEKNEHPAAAHLMTCANLTAARR